MKIIKFNKNDQNNSKNNKLLVKNMRKWKKNINFMENLEKMIEKWYKSHFFGFVIDRHTTLSVFLLHKNNKFELPCVIGSEKFNSP